MGPLESIGPGIFPLGKSVRYFSASIISMSQDPYTNFHGRSKKSYLQNLTNPIFQLNSLTSTRAREG